MMNRRSQTARRQRGLSIPTAIFVLVVIAMLGAAMVNILNQGQEAIAREVLSIRAVTAAESGAERGLNLVLEVNAAACTGDLSNPPSSLAPLISAWNLASPGMSGCEVNVSCGAAAIDSDSDGTPENYYTLRSTGRCGPTSDSAFRIVEVQARN